MSISIYDYRRKPNYGDAVISLSDGNASGGPSYGPVTEWQFNKSAIVPTEAEVQAKLVTLIADWDAIQYQRDRQSNYPVLAEQFDLLWHAIDDGTLDKTSDFYTQLKAVKDDNPKP
jgi:hypothetical protein